MGLIDSHAHLTYPELHDQVDDVLARARAAGVDRVITVGTTPADGERAVALARRYRGTVFAAVGIHPHHAMEAEAGDVDRVRALLDQGDVVAMGEMGLDYFYDFCPTDKQRSIFAAQLAIAAERDLPVIIHSRDAFDDTAAMLVDHGLEHRRVVFHCFTGTIDEARRLAEHGWRASFTGIVTFRKSTELQAIARDYPADQLMVETDSPYLSPEPVRGRKPNEPAHVAHTARFLAELRGVPYEPFTERTAENTRAFFDLA
jgi:TatD DNase family protein